MSVVAVFAVELEVVGGKLVAARHFHLDSLLPGVLHDQVVNVLSAEVRRATVELLGPVGGRAAAGAGPEAPTAPTAPRRSPFRPLE